MRLYLLLLILLSSQQIYAPLIPNNHTELKNEYVIIRDQFKKESELNRFLCDLAISESSGKYETYNVHGYIGKYQFGYAARKETGYSHIKFDKFIENHEIWKPEEQDDAMIKLLKKNESYLSEIIDKIESGELVIMADGKPATKSGILAGAHLSGKVGIKKYVYEGINPKDANGTTLESYIAKFSGYEF